MMNKKKQASVSITFCLAFGITFFFVIALLFFLASSLERKAASEPPPAYKIEKRQPRSQYSQSEPYTIEQENIQDHTSRDKKINGKPVQDT